MVVFTSTCVSISLAQTRLFVSVCLPVYNPCSSVRYNIAHTRTRAHREEAREGGTEGGGGGRERERERERERFG